MGTLNAPFYPERLEEVGDIETKAVLKKLASAHRALAELKATAESITRPRATITAYCNKFGIHGNGSHGCCT